MIWWLSVIVAGILLSATMKGADFAGRWLWANRSKAAGAMNVRVPAWSLAVLTLLFCLLLVAPWRGCELPKWSIPVLTKPELVILLHEDAHGLLPPYAMGAAHDLEAAGYEVRPIDDDVLAGTGDPPAWLPVALEQGRAIMGGTDGEDDALIVIGGGKVLKAVKLPETREAIVEAVK